MPAVAGHAVAGQAMGGRAMGRGVAEPNGFALVVVILAIVTLGLLVSGLIYISGQELWISRATEEVLRTRLAAESAVRGALIGWEGAYYRELPTGTRVDLPLSGGDDPLVDPTPDPVSGPAVYPGVATATTIERLAGPHLLVHSRATLPSGRWSAAASVVRVIEPHEVWSDLPAALNTEGPVEVHGPDALRGYEPGSAPGGTDDCIEEAGPILVQALGSLRRPPVSGRIPGRGGSIALGPLDLDLFLAGADHLVSGTVSPEPVADGLDCRIEVGSNWGEPWEAVPGCSGYHPLVVAPARLGVGGGRGQGILVSDGDLTLSGDTEFHGIIVVRGRLRLEGSAQLHGAAVVTGPNAATTIADRAGISYHPCAIHTALMRTEIMGRPYQSGDRSWIPAF